MEYSFGTERISKLFCLTQLTRRRVQKEGGLEFSFSLDTALGEGRVGIQLRPLLSSLPDLQWGNSGVSQGRGRLWSPDPTFLAPPQL